MDPRSTHTPTPSLAVELLYHKKLVEAEWRPHAQVVMQSLGAVAVIGRARRQRIVVGVRCSSPSKNGLTCACLLQNADVW